MSVATLLPRPVLADRRWEKRAACRPGTDVPPDLFAADTEPARAAALHVCRTHCPVKANCDEEARALIGTPIGYRSMVMGGEAYNQHGRPDHRNLADTRCPLCTFRPSPWPAPGAQGRPGPKDEREPVPCGTTGGYSRHRRRKERACDACRAAHNAAGAPRKREQRRRCRVGECPHPEHRQAVGA